MNFISYKSWVNEMDANVSTYDSIMDTFNPEKDDPPVTVLLPGGFKPLTAGHISLIEKYAQNPFVKEVKVLIGPGVRNGINQEEAAKIASRLLENYPNVTVENVKYPSPILTAYKYIETAEPGYYALAGSKKGDDYVRVKDFTRQHGPGGKYESKKPEGVEVVELPVDPEPAIYSGRTDDKEGTPISASVLRRDVLNNDFENFKTNYPDHDIKTIKDIWEILKPIIVETDEAEYENEMNENNE